MDLRDSLERRGASFAPSGPDGPAVVSVCVTCRGPDEADRAGERLLAALRALAAARAPGVAIRPVQCLSVCKRPCTVAFTAPGRYTYVFGDLDPETSAAAVLEGARSYREQQDGYMLWRERPEALRRGVVARIPPLGWAPADGRHPR